MPESFINQFNECIPAHEKIYINYTRNNQFLLNIATVDKPNNKIQYMLDTGAYNNIIRWNTVLKIGARNIDYSEKLSITGFNLVQSETIGSVKINLAIGNSVYTIKFYIVKELCVPGIIGAAFLKQYTLYVSQHFSYIVLGKPSELNEILSNDENGDGCQTRLNNNENKKDTLHAELKKKHILFSEKSCQTESIISDSDYYYKHDKGCQTISTTEKYMNPNWDKHLGTFIGVSMRNTQNYIDSMRPEYGTNSNPSIDEYFEDNMEEEPFEELVGEEIYTNEEQRENFLENPVYERKSVPEDLESNRDYSLIENRNYKQLDGNDRNRKLFESLNLSHLKQSNFYAMETIMKNHSDVFYLKGDRLTITDAAVHEIETSTNVPINKRQYRFPEATKKHINEEIEEMQRQGIIRPSKSPWNAPVLCIPKKDLDADGNKKYRIVVDFRALNIITKPFVYPIPLINEIFDDIGEAKYFSTLDLKSGFYQVPIHPRDAAKTAFSTPKGHFEFTRMPMGLRNSPSTFQKLMNTVLYELGDIKAIVYLDDIIIFGSTIEEHNENLCRVLEAMRRHNLKIDPTKCQILKTEIKYLGHTIDKDGIRPTQDNIKAIREMQVPKTVKGVRSFLGTVNFYGKFIPKIAEIRKPLNDLLKKNTKFVWTNDCQKAFEDLKKFLTSDSLLVRPNYKDTFVLTTDASEYTIGAVLSNEKSTDKPIAFASRGLIGAERRYHTIDKELLAIVWAVNYFKHYIYNQKFIV